MRRWQILGIVMLAVVGGMVGFLQWTPPARQPSPVAASGGQAATQPSPAPSAPAPSAPAPAPSVPPLAPAAAPGGAVGVVQAYFTALAAGDASAAYKLLAPSWRSGHPYASFAASLPQGAVRLISAQIQSEGNFNADVQAVVQAASGGSAMLALHLVDLNSGPGPSGAAVWRLAAPPSLPAG